MRDGTYSDDVLAASRRAPAPPVDVPAAPGLLVEHPASGFAGRVVALEAGAVVLRDERGRERSFPLRPGVFKVGGRAASLVRPKSGPAAPQRTASGSVHSGRTRARVARASRIYVEGAHDAELVEKVWGDDLRDEGVVVEPLDGIDGLADAIAAFAPGPDRRLGVLVDHLVTGAKERRIADAVAHPYVLVTGHPYVDVWQGVRPAVLGIGAWPYVPPGQPWKEGVCAALGAGAPAELWRRILRAVRSYADLEQPLVGAVERLIDFVTAPGAVAAEPQRRP